MALILHEKEIEDDNYIIKFGVKGKKIVLVKEVNDIKDIVKVEGINYVHYCYHDEKVIKPCKRVKI